MGVLNDDKDFDSANITDIVLIPKIPNPRNIVNFRPINLCTVYELLHTFQQKHTGKKGYMALKLYISKVYDTIEWGFLKEVMLRIGFAKE